MKLLGKRARKGDEASIKLVPEEGETCLFAIVAQGLTVACRKAAYLWDVAPCSKESVLTLNSSRSLELAC